LKRSRYDVQKKGKKFVVYYPAYRQDILHPIDVVEDIIISYGFNKIKPEAIKLPVTGEEKEETKVVDVVREVCIGLGLQEILTFTLSSIEKQQDKLGLKDVKFVEIGNPVSMNSHVFRKTLIPESLEFLSKNKDRELPHRVFEIGKTVELNEKNEAGVEEKNKLCVALSSKDVGFTQIKSALEALADQLGFEYTIQKISNPAFVEGRAAEISIGSKKGILGEINEKTQKNFGLETPVSVLEIEI